MSKVTVSSKAFVKEPMKGKPITAVPGIESKIGGKFTKKQINYAYQLYGQCLERQMDEQRCVQYIQDFGADSGQAMQAYNGMYQWYNNNQ